MSAVHPTAVIDPAARLGEQVDIGPYCVIGPDVRIGAGTKLIAHVVVDGRTTLGEGCLVHPFARLGGQSQDLKYTGGATYVSIGDRTVLRECVTVNSATKDGDTTRVGADCLMMAYSHAAHGVVIGDHVIVTNATQFAGDVRVEDHAIVSGLVAVHQFCRIGAHSMVGGLQKLTQDVPPYMLVDGPEPKIRGINVVGLTRRGFSESTRAALKQAYRLLCRSGLHIGQALARIEAELPALPELQHLVEFYRTSSRGILR